MTDANLIIGAIAFDVGLFVLGVMVLNRRRRHMSRKRRVMAMLGGAILLFGGVDLSLLAAIRLVTGQ